MAADEIDCVTSSPMSNMMELSCGETFLVAALKTLVNHQTVDQFCQHYKVIRIPNIDAILQAGVAEICRLTVFRF